MADSDFLKKQQELMDALLNKANQHITSLVEEQENEIEKADPVDKPNKDLEAMDIELKKQATTFNDMMSAEVTKLINKKSQEIESELKKIMQEINSKS